MTEVDLNWPEIVADIGSRPSGLIQTYGDGMLVGPIKTLELTAGFLLLDLEWLAEGRFSSGEWLSLNDKEPMKSFALASLTTILYKQGQSLNFMMDGGYGDALIEPLEEFPYTKEEIIIGMASHRDE